MKRRICLLLCVIYAATLLGGCALRTVEELYTPPKRSDRYNHLQSAIDSAMSGMEYAAPISGENQQTVQTADLDGDGRGEYILFARGDQDKPLKIMIFRQNGKEFDLSATIDSHGTVFEQVEYVNIDDRPGLEMVISRRVSDQVLRSVSVYTFCGGDPQQLMAANCLKCIPCDLDPDSETELMLIQPGPTEADRGIAVLYGFKDGEMVRSREAELSAAADSVKRIMVSPLQDGQNAVYVASAVDENAIITDIFALKEGHFTNISLSSESGTSVQTLRNYYVYADDIDNDGVLELPDLITMRTQINHRTREEHYLIRWYAMTLSGTEVDKGYTFHNFMAGWYLELDAQLATRLSVVQEGSAYAFYIWDENYKDSRLVFTVYAFTGSDRENAAASDDKFLLYRAEGVVYAASLADGAADYDITQESLTPCFRLIHQDWKTGET